MSWLPRWPRLSRYRPRKGLSEFARRNCVNCWFREKPNASRPPSVSEFREKIVTPTPPAFVSFYARPLHVWNSDLAAGCFGSTDRRQGNGAPTFNICSFSIDNGNIDLELFISILNFTLLISKLNFTLLILYWFSSFHFNIDSHSFYLIIEFYTFYFHIEFYSRIKNIGTVQV